MPTHDKLEWVDRVRNRAIAAALLTAAAGVAWLALPDHLTRLALAPLAGAGVCLVMMFREARF